MMLNNQTAALVAGIALKNKGEKMFYKKQLEKLLKKIEIAEDLDAVKKYAKEMKSGL